MQLTSALTGLPGRTPATPPATPTPARTLPPILGTGTPAVIDAPVAAPDDSTIAAKLLGGIGGAQQRALEGQQLLGAVSALFTARLSHVGSQLWAALRGTDASSASTEA